MGDQNTTLLMQACIDRLAAGDASARNELLSTSCQRLERLTRKMLRDFPGVRRWEQTDDVLQNASVRLCRALEQVAPPTLRDYYRLAAVQIRRELLDLARHYYGPEGRGANHASVRVKSEPSAQPLNDPADSTHDPDRLATWQEFHEQIGTLPDEEREVFELVWYQGLTQEEAAGVLGVSVPTIKRRWLAARRRLQKFLNDGPRI